MTYDARVRCPGGFRGDAAAARFLGRCARIFWVELICRGSVVIVNRLCNYR